MIHGKKSVVRFSVDKVEESVYSNIPGTKDKALKVGNLWVEGSVYSNIPGTKNKALKVRDLWVEESV